VGALVSLHEYRYAKLYREQLALWCSHGLGINACHQIAAHLCRDEFIVRIKSADMRSLNKRLRNEEPPAVPSPAMEEAS
jgi:hypothetical protein